MPPPADRDPASFILVEECFAAEDPGFLEGLRRIDSAKWLAAFADRWKRDPRPWARAQIFAYLDLPLNRPGHEPILKRLFKHAEAQRDDELMGAFLAAFDTLVRRVRRTRWHWNRASRTSETEEYLGAARDHIPRKQAYECINPRTGERMIVPAPAFIHPSGRLFTYRTRHYVRRRVWRYFRRMGFQNPAAYPAAVSTALLRYRDADLEKGEHILDSPGLLNICFRESGVLEFAKYYVNVKDGQSLADLRPAPRFPAAWETPEAVRLLLKLAGEADARLVRKWAIEMFRGLRSCVPVELSAEDVMRLLDHDDEEVQQFGAELFDAQVGLERLPLSTWLRLLETRNLAALATICAAFTRHVSAERLTLEQRIQLACARPVPVARLGLEMLNARPIAPDEEPALARLADAQCPAVAGDLCKWALARLGVRAGYDVELISRFFDSLTRETRDAAWEWLLADSPGYSDPALWSRFAETPFDDLRLKLIDHLAVRATLRGVGPDDLAPVWSAVLLGVHRGGRQKLKAVHQIADAIADEPARIEPLLPVLVVAIRSVRGPEMRAGLAALMSLLARRPELTDAIRARLPELQFPEVEVTA